MNNKLIPKIILVLFGLIILASNVAAAGFSLNSILQPFGSLDIAGFYMRYYEFIDAIIYFLLFMSLAQMIYVKVYKDYNDKKSAKLVAVAVGLCLAISMIVLEMNTGFYLGQLGVVALIILLLVLAMLLYNTMLALFTADNGKRVSAALTYLIIYGLLVVPFGTLFRWIEINAPMLSAVLALGAIAAFVLLIIEMFSMFGGGKGTTTGPAGPAGPTGPTGPIGPIGPLGTPGGTVTPPPGGPYPNDLVDLINNDYAGILAELVNRYNGYAQYFNRLIQMHFDAATPPNREPNAAEWATLLSLRNDDPNGMVWALNQANNLLNAINNHPGYALLNPTDAGRLQNLVAFHGGLNNAITQFEIDARLAYNNRTRPPTITTP